MTNPDSDPLRDEFSAALVARYRRISDREDMDLDAHADWVAGWFARVRADEREKIAQAIEDSRVPQEHWPCSDAWQERADLDALIARNGGNG